MKSVSELRQDIVSGEWVVIATGRAKRPDEFLKTKRPEFKQPKKGCPFEDLHSDALLVYALDGKREKENWWVQAVPNKYPAFGSGICAIFHKSGPYRWTDGVGFHEVIVTRSHDRSIAQMSDEEVEPIICAYKERYLVMKKNECVEYISIFHNHGRQAGATLSHPHSQIIAIPVTPPDFSRSLRGSAAHFKGGGGCVHCLELKYEMSVKKRIIYENEHFIATAPYASKTAFEMRIFPKKHSPNFEDISKKNGMYLANALRVSLAKIFKGLKNPDYNFFLHTAPTSDGGKFNYYHWHFEILPKTAIWAGFEIGTGIEISTIAPETAAEFLRKIKV